METPSKEAIRNALQALGPSRIEVIKARTGLSDVMLYASIFQMEDRGEILSSIVGSKSAPQRTYRLPEQES